MSNIDFLTTYVMYLLSNAKIIFSKKGATDLQKQVFGSQTNLEPMFVLEGVAQFTAIHGLLAENSEGCELFPRIKNHLNSLELGFLNIFSRQNLLRSLLLVLFLLQRYKYGAKVSKKPRSIRLLR